jgi:hypothetical protein
MHNPELPDDNRGLATTIGEIVGRELSSVVFIRDYQQFIFQGPCLSTFSEPKVRQENKILIRKQLGYCDALCAQIDHVVTSVAVHLNELVISFDNHTEILVSLSPDAACAEALMYQSLGEKMLVM